MRTAVLGALLLASTARAAPDATALLQEAKTLEAAGRWREALPACERAVKALRAAKHAALPDALAELAMTQLRLGAAKDAKTNALEALALVPAKPSERGGPILASVAQVMWASGDAERAMKTIDRGLAECEQIKCKGKPQLLYVVAGFLDEGGEYPRAITLLGQIIQACRGSREAELRRTWAMAEAGLAAAYAHAGERAKAEGAFERAVRAYVDVFGEDHPETKALREDIAAFRASR